MLLRERVAVDRRNRSATGFLYMQESGYEALEPAELNNAVTVERNVAPFVGKFAGKQKAPSYEGDLNAQFACYPAHDAALAQTTTFVCYTAEEQPRVPE